MIDRYLFLPDNLMAVLYEEQKIIQSFLDFPFKTAFPQCKTNKEFSKMIIEAPVASNGLIIRPCADDAFILGDAKDKADYVLNKLKNLYANNDKLLFSPLQCKAWYYANVELNQNPRASLSEWRILDKQWVKV